MTASPDYRIAALERAYQAMYGGSGPYVHTQHMPYPAAPVQMAPVQVAPAIDIRSLFALNTELARLYEQSKLIDGKSDDESDQIKSLKEEIAELRKLIEKSDGGSGLGPAGPGEPPGKDPLTEIKELIEKLLDQSKPKQPEPPVAPPETVDERQDERIEKLKTELAALTAQAIKDKAEMQKAIDALKAAKAAAGTSSP